MIKHIVTHKGPAHRDETLSVACALAVAPVAVFRRDPTPEELDDPGVLVLDEGGRHEPELNNFDHHQFARDAAPTCALSLYLDSRLDIAVAREAFPWLEATEVLDSKGPVAFAKWCGCNPDKVHALQSPVEGWLLERFSSLSVLRPGDAVHEVLCSVGAGMLTQYDDFKTRLGLLPAVCSWHDVGGLLVLVVDPEELPGNSKPTLALEAFCRRRRPGCAVTVTADDRGDGLCLFRRNDHPGVDFSRLEWHPRVVFAHKGGFVAKTKPGAGWRELVLAALTGREET